jgi:hypothetical protein
MSMAHLIHDQIKCEDAKKHKNQMCGCSGKVIDVIERDVCI